MGILKPIHDFRGRLSLHWESFLSKLPRWLSPWIRDAVDVGITVLTIIIILKIIFGADMLVPLVVVTSESMVHESGDDSWMLWLTSRGFPQDTVRSFRLSGGFNMGDMILVQNPASSLGDVIIYERDLDHLNFPSRDPIIHRVVGVAYVENNQYIRHEGTLDCFSPQTLQPYIDIVKKCQGGVGKCPYTKYPEGSNFKLFITKGDHNDGTDQCNKRLNIAYPVTESQVTGKALLRLPYLGWPKLLLNIIFRVLTFQF